MTPLEISTLAFIVAGLFMIGTGLYAIAHAEPDPFEDAFESRPKVRSLSLTRRVELRLQIAHEQEEAEAHHVA